MIRVGTAGGLQPSVQDGDHVIVTGAVRDDGFTAGLVPLGFPALASRRVTTALVDAAADRSSRFHEGVALTSAVMYPHQVLGSNLELWQRAGVMAVEQECSSLFVIASLHGADAGSILTIDGNPLADDDTDMSGYDPHRASVTEAVDIAAEIALDALATDLKDGK